MPLYPLSPPAIWPDFVAIFRETLPRAWPKLWSTTSEAWDDIRANGEIMGQARTWLEHILQYIIPSRDIYGFFLDRWEASFGISSAGTIADRIAAIERAMRLRGLGKEDVIKAIFLTAFPGASSLDDIVLTRPEYEDLSANTHQHAHCRAQNCLHISSAGDAYDCDRAVMDDLLVRTAPAWAEWSGGRYLLARYNNADAGWSRGVFESTP